MSNTALIAEATKAAKHPNADFFTAARFRFIPELIAALEAAETPTTVEWGVRLRSRDAAYVSESDARDLAAHYDKPLLKRMVSAWEVQA